MLAMDALLRLLLSNRWSTPMKRTGYDLAFQFLRLADLRGVIAVDGHELKGAEELAPQLVERSPQRRIRRVRRRAVEPIHGIVERFQDGSLLLNRAIEKAFAKERIGLDVHIVQTGPKTLALVRRGPVG